MDNLVVIRDIADTATSVVFGAVTLYFAWKAFVYDREQIQATREANICVWSEKCLRALCAAEGFCELSGHFQSHADWMVRKSEVLGELSAQVDYGRLYFPNELKSGYGLHKETAYQGERQPILDHLVKAHRVVLKSTCGSDLGCKQRKDIVQHRREFISRVHEQINPRRRLGFIKREATLNDSN